MVSQEQKPSMYETQMDAILSRWFTTYEDARISLETEGGFLFPHKNQFFVTSREAIRELGLDPEDPDWDRIERDWVQPKDAEAWERLNTKRMLAVCSKSD